jgi:hypothetical protein
VASDADASLINGCACQQGEDPTSSYGIAGHRTIERTPLSLWYVVPIHPLPNYLKIDQFKRSKDAHVLNVIRFFFNSTPLINLNLDPLHFKNFIFIFRVDIVNESS